MRIIIHMGDAYRDETAIGKRIRVFYERFTACGHEVKILAPWTGEQCKGGEDIIECAVIPLKKKTSLYRLLNGISYGITSVFTSLKVGLADVVLTTSPPPLISISGWLIAKIKRAALVYDVRDIWPDVAWEMGSFSRNSLYSKVFAFIRDFMLRHADLVTTVSKGKVLKLQGYAPSADILEISNGFDREFCKNIDDPALADKYGMDDTFTCVYVGNIGLAQGLQQLLKIAEKAKKEQLTIQFLLFGTGADEQHLKRSAAENGLDNVHFVGRLLNTQIYTILKHADMCFVPLANRDLTDSIPTKMYEALGVGCPVLLCAAGEAVDILEESKLGIAAVPGDFDALWSGFLEMYRSIQGISANKSAAQHLMETKYSRQYMAEVLEKELKKRFGG